MYETDRELRDMQAVLDASYARAGSHLRMIWGEETHGTAVVTDPRGPEAGGFADCARETYDFDWDAAHPTAPHAWIDARTLLAFRRR